MISAHHVVPKTNIKEKKVAKIIKFPSNNKRSCSFRTLSDKGKHVFGTAAFLVESKRAGGVDAFIRKVAETAAMNALNAIMKKGIGETRKAS